MPNAQQKKFLKRKEREKKSREKVLLRREIVREESKEKKLLESQREAEFYLRNGRPEPILKRPEAIAANEVRKKSKVEERLKKNLSILEALEREYDSEHENREKVNDILEAEGNVTVKDKLAALHARAKKLQSLSDALDGNVPLEPVTSKEIGLAAQLADLSGGRIGGPGKSCTEREDSKYEAIEGYIPDNIIDADQAETAVRYELRGCTTK